MIGRRKPAPTPSAMLPAGTVAALRTAAVAAARAMDKTDAGEIQGLRLQVHQLERQLGAVEAQLASKARRIERLEKQVAASRKGESALVAELRRQLAATQRQLDAAMGYDTEDLLAMAAHSHPFQTPG